MSDQTDERVHRPVYLKKVTLRNFRCFDQFDIELHPQLTVLIGLNGCGKTAVLDGIAAGLAPMFRYLSSADQRLSAQGVGIRDTDFRLVRLRTAKNKDRWVASDYAQVVLETPDGLRWDEWRASKKKQGTLPGERVGQRAIARRASEIFESIVHHEERRELLPVFAYYGSQRGIDVPKRLHQTKDNYEQPTSALVDALKPTSNFREMLAWFEREESSELRRNKGVQADETEFSPALEGVREAISLLLDKRYWNPHFNEFHRFVVESAESNTPLQVSQLSQGYQAMLGLAMDFARRLAIGNSHLDFATSFDDVMSLVRCLTRIGMNVEVGEAGVATKLAPAIMLIDEIDLHLHPAWQQRVLSDLVRAFPGTQFIVTTHSPQVLTSVDSASIRLIEINEDADTPADSPKYVVRSGFPQTKGIASADLLSRLMGVNPIPDVPEAHWIADYTAAIENGTHNDDAGRELRKKLEEFYGPQHQILIDADRLIRFQSFKLRKSERSS